MEFNERSNWDVEKTPKSLKEEPVTAPTLLLLQEIKKPHFREVLLPVELVIQIVSCIPRQASEQKTLWACALVSRAWYSASVPILYDRPYLGGHNFQSFVTTICPSKNAHIRKSQLAGLVRTLDMGELVHDGSKSVTARLLGRLKGNLVKFIAPQASFSISSFAALSKCMHLTLLNLSLMSASVPTKLLFQTLQALTHLETLYFPRTAVQNHRLDEEGYTWPGGLKALHFAGGIDDFFLRTHVRNTHKGLECLSIQLCPRVYNEALQETLEAIGPQLQHLAIKHPMPQLTWSALDHTLIWCPNLLSLCISVDYISDVFFESQNVPIGHPLRILELECSESAATEVGISPDSIWFAIDNGCLPNLRCIRISARLAWQATRSLRSSVSDLVDRLEEEEEKTPLGIDTGVWEHFF